MAYGSKSNVGQRARLLLAPGSPSYNNRKTRHIYTSFELPHTLSCQILRHSQFKILSSGKQFGSSMQGYEESINTF